MAIKKSTDNSEKDIERDILDWINRHPNGFAFKVNTVGIYDSVNKNYRKLGLFSLTGTADIIGIWNQRPLAIEVKKKGGRINKSQQGFINKWRKCGGLGLIAFDLSEVKHYLEYFDKNGVTIVS